MSNSKQEDSDSEKLLGMSGNNVPSDHADDEGDHDHGVLPRAAVARVAFLLGGRNGLREDTVARFVEVQVAESPANVPGDSRIEVRLQNGRSLVVGRDMIPSMYGGDCWPCWRAAGDRAAQFAGADRAQGARIWLAAEATDMRCGFDRLAERVRAVIGQDPLGGHLFVSARAAATG